MSLFRSDKTAPSAPKYTTTCKLCRKPIAQTPALEIPIIGHPGNKVEKLMTILLKHLVQDHPKELEEGAALISEFQAFRILSAYEYEDPTMAPRLENIRAAVFSLVRKNGFSDASLQHIVAGFGLDPEDAEKVNQAMRAVRDLCCEIGEHEAKIATPSPLVI